MSICCGFHHRDDKVTVPEEIRREFSEAAQWPKAIGKLEIVGNLEIFKSPMSAANILVWETWEYISFQLKWSYPRNA
jgi:hypothetical protein